MGPVARRVSATINRIGGHNGVPFHSAVAMTPRTRERWMSWSHYGVMVPGLPGPHRFFGVMAVLGTTGARCFDHDERITTTPRDTAYVVSGTAATPAPSFQSYAMARECELREDGSRLAFGSGGELVLEQRPGAVAVKRAGPVPVTLELELTDVVSTFSRIPGIYDHWSLLARCRGTVGELEVDTLATWEYARGAGPYSVARRVVPAWAKAPIASFTYQVLNLDEETQLLLTVAGPKPGVHVHEGAWERGLHDHGSVHPDAVFTVEGHRAEPLTAPSGRTMRMPARWRWAVRDVRGGELCTLRCAARDDWVFGLGAGYVGSFDYAGEHRGRAVEGTGYVEFIEL